MIFLVQSPHAWRGVWQRPHHLMTRFAAAGHGVRYVESRYLSWLLKDPGRFQLSKPEQPAPGIEVRPVTLLAGERFAFIRRINKVRLIRALAEPHHADKALKRVLWLYNPHEAHLAEFVPHDVLVYDIMDEYQGFPWSPKEIAEPR